MRYGPNHYLLSGQFGFVKCFEFMLHFDHDDNVYYSLLPSYIYWYVISGNSQLIITVFPPGNEDISVAFIVVKYIWNKFRNHKTIQPNIFFCKCWKEIITRYFGFQITSLLQIFCHGYKLRMLAINFRRPARHFRKIMCLRVILTLIINPKTFFSRFQEITYLVRVGKNWTIVTKTIST